MAQTKHVEMREGEQWSDVAEAFLTWCFREKGKRNAGCHEGDPIVSPDQKRYAAISIPDHTPDLVNHLFEWAKQDGRKLA
jgi:hypothetical protein